MIDETAVLHTGERNRVWFRLGDDAPDGPYEIAFVNALTRTATAWTTAEAGTYPDTTDGRGIYVWARNGTAPGTDPTGTLTLTSGNYRCRIRHIDGYLVDVAPLDILEVE
jgi:hypothetical protein